MVIVCAADDHYCFPLAIMLFSALKNYRGRDKIKIYVLDAGISTAKEKRVRRVLSNFSVEIHWLRPDAEVLNGLPTRKYLNIVTYYRLFVAELLPPTIEKALFLDCDMLVEDDLGELWRLDLDDYYFLAARDPTIRSIGRSPLKSSHEVKFDEDSEYFNSGVLLMNLARLREDNVATKVIEFTQRWRSLIRFPGQDGLNAIALGKWGRLDPRWNWCVKDYEQKFRFRGDAIIHFIGSAKPWLSHRSKSYEPDGIGDAHRSFDAYADSSGWFTPVERYKYKAVRAFLRYSPEALQRIVIGSYRYANTKIT